MVPGQLIAPGQLTDPGVNFASVHGSTPGNPPCRGNFSPCEQNAKVAPGQEQSCACSLSMFGINFPIKSLRKHQKYMSVFKIHSL